MSVIDEPNSTLVVAVNARLAAIVIHGRRRTSREEARAVDDVSLAAHDRRDERRQLLRIELEVGILDRDDRAAGGVEAEPNRRAFAGIPLGVDHRHRDPDSGSLGFDPGVCRHPSRSRDPRAPRASRRSIHR